MKKKYGIIFSILAGLLITQLSFADATKKKKPGQNANTNKLESLIQQELSTLENEPDFQNWLSQMKSDWTEVNNETAGTDAQAAQQSAYKEALHTYLNDINQSAAALTAFAMLNNSRSADVTLENTAYEQDAEKIMTALSAEYETAEENALGANKKNFYSMSALLDPDAKALTSSTSQFNATTQAAFLGTQETLAGAVRAEELANPHNLPMSFQTYKFVQAASAFDVDAILKEVYNAAGLEETYQEAQGVLSRDNAALRKTQSNITLDTAGNDIVSSKIENINQTYLNQQDNAKYQQALAQDSTALNHATGNLSDIQKKQVKLSQLAMKKIQLEGDFKDKTNLEVLQAFLVKNSDAVRAKEKQVSAKITLLKQEGKLTDAQVKSAKATLTQDLTQMKAGLLTHNTLQGTLRNFLVTKQVISHNENLIKALGIDALNRGHDFLVTNKSYLHGLSTMRDDLKNSNAKLSQLLNGMAAAGTQLSMQDLHATQKQINAISQHNVALAKRLQNTVKAMTSYQGALDQSIVTGGRHQYMGNAKAVIDTNGTNTDSAPNEGGIDLLRDHRASKPMDARNAVMLKGYSAQINQQRHSRD
ncbi:MAG: hypothetical protein DHS20C10_11110 [marine bacterium B5-7]|nr:MAG: hypothetical protein DHS20C10_11110 [marine bacterium B5-7]